MVSEYTETDRDGQRVGVGRYRLGMLDCKTSAGGVRLAGFLTGAPRSLRETAVQQIQQVGYKPEEVRHIVMTHMHVDHGGGLADFPQAKIHIYKDEYEAILHPQTLLEKQFYIPAHWVHGPDWAVHSLNGAQWFDHPCTDPLPIEGVDIRLIPFPGHSRGLCAVAIALPDERWLLHCGGAYYQRKQVNLSIPFRPPPGLVLRILLIGDILHVSKLRALRERLGERLTIFCSHDPVELEEVARV